MRDFQTMQQTYAFAKFNHRHEGLEILVQSFVESGYKNNENYMRHPI